ncbi:hypothetical protein EAG18_00080 [Pseudoalteromonas sp. J010]|nr:hypothetical protein EAG18_00080 [Pseudoalteromonas sp. J010]
MLSVRLFILVVAILLSGCTVASQTLTSNQWRYATDPHGSQATYDEGLVQNGVVSVHFTRVPRVDKANNSWVELIYDLPQQLTSAFIVTLAYKSDKAVIVKLSQQEYGGLGDKSYAHYQSVLPASNSWQVVRLSLSDFERPSWTPEWSKDKGIVLEHISALYFVPDLKDATGGEATLSVNRLEIE